MRMEPEENHQSSTTETCPTCGTTKISFNPPIEIELVDRCEVAATISVHIVDKVTKYVERCVLGIHDNGDHVFLIEEVVRYPNA